ncbi:MAG: hypothetical protein Q7T01_01015 [bacterium]|nr:hypothetical protein [bacterium]
MNEALRFLDSALTIASALYGATMLGVVTHLFLCNPRCPVCRKALRVRNDMLPLDYSCTSCRKSYGASPP